MHCKKFNFTDNIMLLNSKIKCNQLWQQLRKSHFQVILIMCDPLYYLLDNACGRQKNWISLKAPLLLEFF